MWPEKGREESTAQRERMFFIYAPVTANGDKQELSFNHTERNKQTGPPLGLQPVGQKRSRRKLS